MVSLRALELFSLENYIFKSSHIGATAVILTLLQEFCHILRRILIDRRFFVNTGKIQLNEKVAIQESGEAFDIFFLGKTVDELAEPESKFFIERSWEKLENLEEFHSAFEFECKKDPKKIRLKAISEKISFKIGHFKHR